MPTDIVNEPVPFPEVKRYQSGIFITMRPMKSKTQEGARHCRKPLGRRSVTKGSIYRCFELVTTAPFDCGNSLG